MRKIYSIDMDNIQHADFRRLDLNLLVAFDALMQERSVSRAAERLYIGQPAMSHALARLRELFGDELLFRNGAVMEPTSRALELAARIRPLLMQAGTLTQQSAFDPSTLNSHVRISMSDPLEAILLPGLIARLREQARGLTLSVQPSSAPMQLELLDRGEILLAAGHFPELRDVHQAVPLLDVPYYGMFNPALVPLGEAPTLEQILSVPHIHTAYGGDSLGIFDRALKRQGLQRRIVVRSASLLSIPFVVSQSALFAVLPAIATRPFLHHSELRIVPIPLDGLSLALHVVSHRRNQADPLVAYLAGLIIDSGRELFPSS